MMALGQHGSPLAVASPEKTSNPTKENSLAIPPRTPTERAFVDQPRASRLHYKQDTDASDSGSRMRRTAVSEDEHARTSNRRRLKASSHLRLPRLLPADRSSYADEYFPIAAQTASSTTLYELAHIVKFHGFQERKRAQCRRKTNVRLVCVGLSSRFIRAGHLAKDSFMDGFRADDKKAFATLYNATHDVRNSIEATRRYNLLHIENEFERSIHDPARERPHLDHDFMHEIPTKSRDELIAFISAVRTDPEFLIQRILSLAPHELEHLTSLRPAADPKSVLARPSTKGKVGAGSSKLSSSLSPSPVERLLSFQRHDPFSALFSTIFASSSGPDSAEDLRRTEVWSTVCANLISDPKAGPGKERLVQSVFDAYAEMREWPVKQNLALYLMQILREGQFLLDKPEKLVTQTSFTDDPAEQKFMARRDDFFESAIKRLFMLIDDDPTAGGIPEGVLEIGLAIYRKLEDKKHRSLLGRFIAHHWFFNKFLMRALIFPEYHGIMTDYYISPGARKTILEQIAHKAQKHVLDMTYQWPAGAPPVPPKIRSHVENILNRLKQSRHASKPVLIPTKTVSSPRETSEVQPWFMICPADIVTLVKALFPEPTLSPQQFSKTNPFHTSFVSAGSSISAFSMAAPGGSTPGDGSSILSMSVSSATSDTTSRAPLLDAQTVHDSQSSLESAANLTRPNRPSSTEEYGRRIRMACHDMVQSLGMEAAMGVVHPCAERWSVLYVSSTGRYLRLRARKDFEDDEEYDEDFTSSDSDNEGMLGSMDLASDYNQLKQGITQLFQEFEVPIDLIPEVGTKELSNRAPSQQTQSQSPRKKRSKPEVGLGASPKQLRSNNPYLNGTQQRMAQLLASKDLPSPSPSASGNAANKMSDISQTHGSIKPTASKTQTKSPPLVIMLETAIRQCEARTSFISAQMYHRTLQQLLRVSQPSLRRNDYAQLLHYLSRGPRESLSKCFAAIEEFDAWSAWLKQAQERVEFAVDATMSDFTALRDKMWYVSEVCHSAEYNEARTVILALRTMGMPRKLWESKNLSSKSRSNQKANGHFFLKQESQVFELMAAANDMGGPNKLSDEQCDKVLKWMGQFGIENLAKGEERLHRFNLEIDQCVNKLVQNDYYKAGVLWLSELYSRDKIILDCGHDKGDVLLTGTGSLSIAGDDDVAPKSRALGFSSRPSSGSLRSIAGRNASQQSIESLKWNASKPVDILDAQDYLGSLNPILTIDSTVTFWSPARSDTVTSSLAGGTPANGRFTPITLSRNSIMPQPPPPSSDEKKRFVLRLKNTLIELLLSDFHTLVFATGSETDEWFSGDIGQEFINIREAEERRRKRIAKKKSMRSLKNGDAAKDARSGVDALSSTDHTSTSTSSDATARPHEHNQSKDSSLGDFDFTKAFRRILHKFSTNTSPFKKLKALQELETMIVASLPIKTPARSNVALHSHLSPVLQNPQSSSTLDLPSRERQAAVPVQQAQNLEEVIANVTSRRSMSMGKPNQRGFSEAISSPEVRDTGLASTRASSISASGNTDMVVEALVSLFRDREIRPKSLFRDLQSMLAFVPGQTLDSPAGKALWDTALAALSMKQDSCRIMVETAYDIVVYHAENRTGNTTASAPEPAVDKPTLSSSTAAADEKTQQQAQESSSDRRARREEAYQKRLAQYTLADAARMLVICAKEGDPIAERELATFYLTHDELLPRTLLPLTRPRDVFKPELLKQHRESERRKAASGVDGGGGGMMGGGNANGGNASGGIGGGGGAGGGGSSALDRGDPMVVCLAHHWMECSKKGGDQLAAKYLRNRDDFDRIPGAA